MGKSEEDEPVGRWGGVRRARGWGDGEVRIGREDEEMGKERRARGWGDGAERGGWEGGEVGLGDRRRGN